VLHQFPFLQDNYDFRSIGWGSVTEQIEISADMPSYCFDCTVYLAVYGYVASGFLLQASSTGLTSLTAGHAMGGHVGANEFAYYSFHNAEQFALMRITLTVVCELHVVFVAKNIYYNFCFVLPTPSFTLAF
jgi:hypothetical protein